MPKRVEPGPGVRPVPGVGQVGNQPQRVGHAQVLVQRGVLRDEGDAVERLGRAGRDAAEHGDLPAGLADEPDGQLQQRGLARPVRADQGDDPSGRDGQRAIAQRPGAPVALAEAVCLNRVHEAFAPLLPRRRS